MRVWEGWRTHQTQELQLQGGTRLGTPTLQLCLLHHWMTIPYLYHLTCIESTAQPSIGTSMYVCVCTCLLVLPYVLLCSLKLKKIPNRRLGPLLCRLMSGQPSSSPRVYDCIFLRLNLVYRLYMLWQVLPRSI